MEYIRVADIADLPANKMITVVVKGQEVLLANIDGAYYAIANKCTHLGGSLSKGVLDGNVVKCPSRYILAMRYFEISAYNRSVADVLKKALGHTSQRSAARPTGVVSFAWFPSQKVFSPTTAPSG
jgi:hypothetical protein